MQSFHLKSEYLYHKSTHYLKAPEDTNEEQTKNDDLIMLNEDSTTVNQQKVVFITNKDEFIKNTNNEINDNVKIKYNSNTEHVSNLISFFPNPNKLKKYPENSLKIINDISFGVFVLICRDNNLSNY